MRMIPVLLFLLFGNPLFANIHTHNYLNEPIDFSSYSIPEIISTMNQLQKSIRASLLDTDLAIKDRDQLWSLDGELSGLFSSGSISGEGFESRRLGDGEVFILQEPSLSEKDRPRLTAMIESMTEYREKHPNAEVGYCFEQILADLQNLQEKIELEDQYFQNLLSGFFNNMRTAIDTVQERMINESNVINDALYREYSRLFAWAEKSYIITHESFLRRSSLRLDNKTFWRKNILHVKFGRFLFWTGDCVDQSDYERSDFDDDYESYDRYYKGIIYTPYSQERRTLRIY